MSSGERNAERGRAIREAHVAAFMGALESGPLTAEDLRVRMFRAGVDVSRQTVHSLTLELAASGAVRAEKIKTRRSRTGQYLVALPDVDACAWEASVQLLRGARQVFCAPPVGRMSSEPSPFGQAIAPTRKSG